MAETAVYRDLELMSYMGLIEHFDGEILTIKVRGGFLRGS